MRLHKKEGFILLEAMVALIVMTGGSVVIFESYRNSLQVISRSANLYLAALALEGRLGELEQTGHWDEAKGLLEQGLYTH